MRKHAPSTVQRDYTVATLAERMDKPETWVRSQARRIPGAYLLGRHYRFDALKVEAWIAAGADLDAG